MPQTEKKDIWFESADGQHRVGGFFVTSPAVKPFCLVQLSHGMCEYLERYIPFAKFLALNGAIVCGNDHLGHGRTASVPDDLGYFSALGGRRYLLEDLHTMNNLARAAFPGLPLVMLGHSMGSFLARHYAVEWPEDLDGLAILGTGGPRRFTNFGISLARRMVIKEGPQYRSEKIHKAAFGAYLRKISKPKTPYDWISRDEDVVAAYNQDPKCTFQFTANGFHELFSMSNEVNQPRWAKQLPKDMPILVLAGTADPVGGYGKGVRKVIDWMEDANIKNLAYKFYPDARHELLNETNRREVYADILTFLQLWRKPR